MVAYARLQDRTRQAVSGMARTSSPSNTAPVGENPYLRYNSAMERLQRWQKCFRTELLVSEANYF